MKFTLACVVCMAVTCAFAIPRVYADDAPAKRTVIHSQSELPTHSYKLTTPTASALLDDDAALLVLAEAVRKDAEATLANYDIADKATLRDLYGAICNAALLREDAEAALACDVKLRAMGEKPAETLTTGLRGDAAAAAIAAGNNPQERKAAFQKAFAASVNPLPWAVVRDDVIAWKGLFETPNLGTTLRGAIQGSVDPVVKKSGEMSWDIARRVMITAVYLRRMEPYAAQARAVLSDYIAEHKQTNTDIWSARKFSLETDKNNLTPVVVAIWDSGVDTSLFPGRLYTNSAEKLDGRDNDRNGFIDDIHGIGFDEDGNPASGSLTRFDAKYPGRETELRELNVGRSDIRDGVESAAAKVFKARQAALKAEEVQPLAEAEASYFEYAHGTSVAAIAMDSNPAARLMVMRVDFGEYKTKPPAYTPDHQRRVAELIKAIVDYMKTHGARVVNMSWGYDEAGFEESFETNGIGKDADDRRKMALAAFNAESDVLTQAFRDAPEILFVGAAGNLNRDIGFARAFPADIALPNVLTVGAVDQAGDEASFTSYGERVRVYASGHQVESFVPGGTKMRMSGTSMAAPQVTNLAAKLFALNPKLTPTEVIKLILDSATKSSDGKRLLINPKASVALLEAKH